MEKRSAEEAAAAAMGGGGAEEAGAGAGDILEEAEEAGVCAGVVVGVVGVGVVGVGVVGAGEEATGGGDGRRGGRRTASMAKTVRGKVVA